MSITGACCKVATVWLLLAGHCNVAFASEVSSSNTLVLAEASKPDQIDAESKKEPTPEEKMRARYPQPVLVGHLLGLPVLDGNDSTLGYVKQVVRTREGEIKLIVPYAKRFGWARDGGWLTPARRPVAVPIEAVAILALQINAVDMDRLKFANAPVWVASEGEPVPSDEVIKIALGRR